MKVRKIRKSRKKLDIIAHKSRMYAEQLRGVEYCFAITKVLCVADSVSKF